MNKLEYTIVVIGLFVFRLVPGLVWVTLIPCLYQLIREAVKERRAALDELHRTV